MESSLGISVIIPTINRHSDLRNTIEDLLKQTHRKFEIIVVDQSSSIDCKEMLLLDKRIRYVHRPDFSSASKARNLGIALSVYEILLFLDDDVVIDTIDFLIEHLRPYKDQNVPGVVGCILEKRVEQEITYKRSKMSFARETGWLFFPQNYGSDTIVGSGRSCNLSIRRNIAIEVRGMDENYDRGAHREEADFCERVRADFGMFYFSSTARLIHIGNYTGGIRSWTKKARILKAQHHYDGAIYFILKNVRFRHYALHLFSVITFFFINKELLKRPHLLLLSFWRLFRGFINAVSLLRKGPKYLAL